MDTYILTVTESVDLALCVNGVLVYADEERGRRITVGALNLGLHDLPVPASTQQSEAADLPAPSAEPGVERSGE